MSLVIWHDVECGSYRRDLSLWLALAAEHPGGVLDVGAGTGRVTIPLARAGHPVLALDLESELLSELQRRARGLPVATVAADARDFSIAGDRSFPLVVVPMQTVQLLGGTSERTAFLACARRYLAPGGAIAIAIAQRFEEFDLVDGEAGPLPDMQELDGVLYSSQPTSVRRTGSVVTLERRREIVDARGARTVSMDLITLDVVSVGELEREGAVAGLRPLAVRRIAPTDEHVGSEVVILGD